MKPRARIVVATLVLATACLSQESSQAWPKSALLEAPALASLLESSDAKPPVLLCVAPSALYKAKRLPHAVFAGQGSKPEGIEILKKAVAGVAKDADLVIYCGCCPMVFCPNVRPAYRALKDLGFEKVRILNIPTNMHTDWYTKNYPTEPGDAGKESSRQQ